jgi:hypothetical protein
VRTTQAAYLVAGLVAVKAILLAIVIPRFAVALIRHRDDRLVIRAVGSTQIPPRVMAPASDTRFFDKRGSECTFERASDGVVTDLVIRDGVGRR